MNNGRNKLYTLLFIACLAGYIWLFYSIFENLTEKNSVDVCLIKHLTNIPCPSCGSTRSIISLTKGHFIEAISINPIGLVIALIMFISPIWIFLDIATKNYSLFNFYKKTETYLKKPIYAIPLILLVLSNWIWNIIKGL